MPVASCLPNELLNMFRAKPTRDRSCWFFYYYKFNGYIRLQPNGVIRLIMFHNVKSGLDESTGTTTYLPNVSMQGFYDVMAYKYFIKAARKLYKDE